MVIYLHGHFLNEVRNISCPNSHNCLLVVDTVASLGAVPFSVDELKIDVCYSGSQKVLGSPPGLAPITFGPRAV